MCSSVKGTCYGGLKPFLPDSIPDSTKEGKSERKKWRNELQGNIFICDGDFLIKELNAKRGFSNCTKDQ